MNYVSDTLYKVDSKGKIRIFNVEVEGEKFRMTTGLEDGKKTTSKWKTCKAKNVGRSNSTTPCEQADNEAVAKYEKKLAEHYYETREEALANPDAFFKVMLALKVEEVKVKPTLPVIADPKLDGMRLVENTNYSLSRRGKPVPAAQWIDEELRDFLDANPNITLDGEIYNHEFHEDFNTLMSIARRDKMNDDQKEIAKTKLEYHVYDFFDSDHPDMSAIDRKHKLALFPIYSDRIKEVPFIQIYDWDILEELKGQHLEDGYEGTIIRTYDSAYEHKRSKNLLKIKQFVTEEFPVLDITPGDGNRHDIAGRIHVDVAGVSVGCGLRGSWEHCRVLLDNRDEYIGKLATIRHFGLTKDGSLRHGTCVDINRPD